MRCEAKKVLRTLKGRRRDNSRPRSSRYTRTVIGVDGAKYGEKRRRQLELERRLVNHVRGTQPLGNANRFGPDNGEWRE